MKKLIFFLLFVLVVVLIITDLLLEFLPIFFMGIAMHFVFLCAYEFCNVGKLRAKILSVFNK